MRTDRGQVDAIERALEGEQGCAAVLQLVAAVRGAIRGLMGEVMEDHIRMHVVDPPGSGTRSALRGPRS